MIFYTIRWKDSPDPEKCYVGTLYELRPDDFIDYCEKHHANPKFRVPPYEQISWGLTSEDHAKVWTNEKSLRRFIVASKESYYRMGNTKNRNCSFSHYEVIETNNGVVTIRPLSYFNNKP